MGLNSFLRRIFRREDEEATPDRQSSGAATIRGGAVRIYYAGENTAMSVAAVYRCVTLLADAVASLRLRYLRSKDGVYIEDEGSPFHYLLTVQPQPERSIYDFWIQVVSQMLLCGNAYIYPRRFDGEVTDLVLCNINTVAHDYLNGIYTIHDPYNGVDGQFREPDIIHLYLHTRDGGTGESVLSYARRTIDLAQSGEDETRNRFEMSGIPRGIISNGSSVRGFGEYSDNELEKAAIDVDAKFKNGEYVVSVPGQVDFKQVAMSAADMQFLESRKLTIRDICRFFGCHPTFVFDDTSNNYKSAEQANVEFLSKTIDPILKRIEAEFNRKLVPRSMCCRRVFRFDRMDVYSLDLASRADYQMKTIQAGLYSINDWRRKENQPTIEGGDTIYISTNLAALGSEKLGNANNTHEDE